MSNTEPDLTHPGLALDAVSSEVDLGPERAPDHFAGAEHADAVDLPPLPEPQPEPMTGIAPDGEADG